jgi:membrane protein implicated in regulation of membrane protease activity
MTNQTNAPLNQNEEILGLVFGAFILAVVPATLALGLGLVLLGFTKAIGLALLTLVIATAYFTRKLVKQHLKSKN